MLAAISSAGPLRLLFVGRLCSCKRDSDVLIEALRKVSLRAPLTMTIVGDGPERSKLELQTAGLSDQIEFSWRGWVPPDTLPELYRGHQRAHRAVEIRGHG